MGCYTVPAAAAIMHFLARKKSPNFKSKHQLWLNQLYLGAGIFGIIDHIWNRELLRFSMSDVLLGFLITLGITIAWAIIVTIDIYTNKHIVKS